MEKKGEAQKILDEITSKTHHHHKKHKLSWKKIAIALGTLLTISVIINLFSVGLADLSITSNDEVGSQVKEYIETNFIGTTVEIISVTAGSGIYEIEMNLQNQQGSQKIISYVNKDVDLLFPSAIELVSSETDATNTPSTPAQPSADIVKSDKPVVELFVMSHCPFGTQVEKGILPVADLLKDKIDFEIKFVNYAMHGEKEVNEEMRQVCIQEEQNDKYFKYLWSFLESDDYAKALKDANIDETKLGTCVEKLDSDYTITELLEDESTWQGGQFPQFNVHDAENQKYGVRGSPTLVINGEQVSSARDPASLLANICAAFNNAPDECNEELSSTSPASGFGLDGAGAASAATCG